MQLFVSSSLEGRDLALLKSVVNILHSDYSDKNKIGWFYTDSIKHHIYIFQEHYQHGAEYYALIKAQDKKIDLGSEINPKNLRQMFTQIAHGEYTDFIDTRSTALSNDSNSLLSQVLRYTSSKTELMMQIMGLAETNIIIDQANDQVWSTVPLDHALIKTELFAKPQNIKFLSPDKKIDLKTHQFNTQASHFLWQMGLLNDQSLINPEFTETTTTFKQTHWPDYGRLEFKDCFISLSALLWRRAESYHSLVSCGQFTDQEVKAFLNASCLSAFCTPSLNSEPGATSFKPLAPLQSQGFLGRLKQKLFGKGG